MVPSPRRRQPGRLVALPQAAGVHEVLPVRPRVVLVEADGPDGHGQRLDGRARAGQDAAAQLPPVQEVRAQGEVEGLKSGGGARIRTGCG